MVIRSTLNTYFLTQCQSSKFILLIASGVVECMEGSECGIWEGMKGGVVWCDVAGPDLGMWRPLGNLCVEAYPA